MSLDRQLKSDDGLAGQRSRHNVARAAIVAVLIVSLLLTAATRRWATDYRETAQGEHFVNRASSGGGSANRQLSAMPSYATTLLLGGLRGPLVMMLWLSSETQKQQNDLQDLDTKIEWIRLLQPEYDTVHLFQIWNKAYNISVKMASLADKYLVILDSLDYAQRVDSERPDDINIVFQIADVYCEKLGGSQEKVFYRDRVRRESQTLMRVSFPPGRESDFRTAATALGWKEESAIGEERKSGRKFVRLPKFTTEQLQKTFNGPDVVFAVETLAPAGERRSRLGPFLDENGRILPEYLKATYPGQPYDGAALGPLEKYQPFPYGLSPVALGFSYYKRAQLLQTNWGVHALQPAESVIDSRPPVVLKMWAMEEWERGLLAECRILKQPVPGGTNAWDLELPSLKLTPDMQITDQPALDMAEYGYAMAGRLFADSYTEFERTCKAYPDKATVYQSHLEDADSGRELMQADLAYLRSFRAGQGERLALFAQARQHYLLAKAHYQMTILQFFIDDSLVEKLFPIDPKTKAQYNRGTIISLPLDHIDGLFNSVMREIEHAKSYPAYAAVPDQFQQDRQPYVDYIEHCAGRLKQIAPLLSAKVDPLTSP